MLDLPARHSHFTGRDEELARVNKALEYSNLLLIEGAAGSGKSALAIEVAGARRKRGLPGVWLRARPGWSAETLLSQLDRYWTWCTGQPAPENPPELPLEERVVLWAREFSRREATVVVDDFHHLADGKAWVLGNIEVLRRGCLVLTSRRAVELPALTLADSVLLRLGGLDPPQTIRLATRLLEHHGLEGWLVPQRLDALLKASRGFPLRLKLLVSFLLRHPESSPADLSRVARRQDSELIAKLEEDLSPAESDALRRLSLFRHPVPPAALGVPESVLLSLSDRLLLEPGPDGGWSAHDLFGEAMRQHLSEQELARLHQRAADYFETLPLDASTGRELLHHLEASGQLERAREVLGQVAPTLYQTAQYDYLLETAQRLETSEEPEASALKILRGEVLAMVGQTQAALKLFMEAEQKGDEQQKIRAMNSRCHLLLEHGELSEASAIAKASLVILEGQRGRRPGRVKALNALALAAARQGRREQALSSAEAALEICREIEDPKGACYAHYAKSLAHRHQGEWESSLHCARGALASSELARETRLGFLAAFIEGFSLLQLGRVEEAQSVITDHWRKSLAYPDPLSQAVASLGHGMLLACQDQLEQAVVFAENGVNLGSQHRGRVFLTQLHLGLGDLYQQRGERELARAQFQTALELATRSGAFPFQHELEDRLESLEGHERLPYLIHTHEGRRLAGPQEVEGLRQRGAYFDLFIDLPRRRAWVREKGETGLLRRKVLTRLLLALLKSGGRPLSQEELYEEVWDLPYEAESSGPQVRKNVGALRQLLEPHKETPIYLLNREGGYARKGGYHWSSEHSFCLVESSEDE